MTNMNELRVLVVAGEWEWEYTDLDPICSCETNGADILAPIRIVLRSI